MNLVTHPTRREGHREQFPKPRIAIDASTVMLAAHGSGAMERVYNVKGEKGFKHHLRNPQGIESAARSAFFTCF